MRMMGHPTLLLLGKDHAGIQTEVAFSNKLESERLLKLTIIPYLGNFYK
jgi:valyl-tRNA synthetase